MRPTSCSMLSRRHGLGGRPIMCIHLSLRMLPPQIRIINATCIPSWHAIHFLFVGRGGEREVVVVVGVVVVGAVFVVVAVVVVVVSVVTLTITRQPGARQLHETGTRQARGGHETVTKQARYEHETLTHAEHRAFMTLFSV